ncbi:multidrug resistance-associated protein 1-like [Tropilaelaps mercedesae]|uniref:ABC-type glutathione-S-conjugate transporter n=1 Tax=Tropilaelaps mercedesae TaxID=418985 RepID=A0A1V9XL97_9ACAR|nr:multidrug resistance-associated protein 1-like [Tropilaelaps mercedesae]
MSVTFCKGVLWEETFWGDKPPVLTECFENTVLIYLPALFILLGGIIYLYGGRTWSGKVFPITALHCAKLAGSAILAAVHAYGAYFALFSATASRSDFVAEFLRVLNYVMVCLIQVVDRKRGTASSAFLSVFWLVTLILDMPIYYRHMLSAFGPNELDLQSVEEQEYVIWAVAYPIVFSQFVLAAFSERTSKLSSDHANRNPIYTASPMSKALFGFFTDFIITGYRRTLAIKDLPQPLDNMRSEYCYRSWMDTIDTYQAAGCRIGIVRSLLLTYWPVITVGWIAEIFFVTSRASTFLALNELILYMNEPNEPTWKGYVYAALIFIVFILSSMMIRYGDYVFVGLGLKIKAGLTAAIVRKSLRINSTQLGKYTVGELVNLLAVDADKINQFSFYVGIMVGCPFYLFVCSAMLWSFLGASCLAGISVIIIMMPLSGTVASWCRNVQVKQMDLKDCRLKYISEILSSIKIIKFYGWEPPFIDRVRQVRYKENELLKRFAYLTATLRFFWSITPFLVSLFAFIAYLYVNDLTMIDANVAFVSLSLFNSMRFSLAIIPDVISNAVQTLVSVRRIEEFLNAEELEDVLVGRKPGAGNALSWSDATLTWNEEEREPTLKKINLKVRSGELVAIVGRVGSGKSSLLQSMLGDLKLVEGHVDLVGSVAYVPQQAWIQNATIKQNILFMKQYSRLVYKRVLDKCCLSTDLKILPGGEETEIGEKGVTLSGGQKQRISLARAVYQDRDVYFLDDPLSAVDAHVGSAIFRNVIGNTGMLKGKTRVFVTNMLSVLPKCDRIIVLKDGKIVEQGTYQDLKNAVGEFSEFFKEHTRENKEDTDIEPETPSTTIQRSMSIVSNDSVQFFNDHGVQKLIAEEAMQSGSVNLSVYGRYLSKIGVLVCFVIIIGFASARTFDILSGIWLSDWSEEKGGSEPEHYAMRSRRILVYAALGLLYGVFSFIGTAALASGTITAARKLHNVMLRSVIKAPMSFFDTTPLGRLLNRFGKDVDQLDIQLPVVANLFLEMFFQLIGVLVLVTINVPIFLAISFPLLVLYFVFQRVYMRSIRQVKRIESVTRSPVYNHFSEMVNGLSSVRAYGAEQSFIVMSDSKIDTTLNCSYLLFLGKMWLGTRLDIVSNIIVLVGNLLIVTHKGLIDPGVAGFVVSYSMGTSFAFNFIVHYASEVEASIVASERIDEYADVKPEADWIVEPRPTAEWPENGAVTFDNYSTRYRDGLELVLKGIDLDIHPSEKVGVVGRTGAGKSSLTLSLFRIIEAAGGQILIDGVDISKIGLHDLRRRLTIIPQDPVIFSGTLRVNIDPNNLYTDEEVWSALERAHVKSQFVGVGLDTEIAEGGANLSVGQKQLLCLARAILQKKKILVMDEATAAVDVETDALIQATIRQDFADCTIITIAHRLNTILDSDRVIVMDAGRIVEQGAPALLLQDSNSHFYSMAQEAGLVQHE